MGVLIDYSKQRIDEIRAEFRKVKKGPLEYIRTNQPLRKALLLEWLDFGRPVVGTRWEHKVEAMEGKT